MRRRWVPKVIAVGIAAIVWSGSPLGAGRALGQDASSPPLPAGTFLTSLSEFALPEEARIAADAAVEVLDTPPVRTTVDPDAIATRAAAIVEGTDAAYWNLGPLAERLDYAPLGAFEFVRDSIGYDAYDGVLRGPQGTLAARAGNDIDRALLLRALLQRMMVPTRIAVGTLDGPATAALRARSFQAPTKPLADAPIDPLELGDVPALAARARRDYAVVRQAIGDLDTTMDPLADTATAPDASQHVWVQMRFGTEWLDLDPSMPDSQPGQTLTAASDELYEVPEEWRDTLDVRVFAEVLSDGVLTEQTVLDQTLDAADASRKDIFLTMSPVGDSIGDTINEALGSGAGWRPTLSVGDESFQGSAFPVTPESDIFSGTQTGGEFSRLRLEVTVSVPGSEPETIGRTLVDRLSADARGSSPIPPAALAPLTVRQQVPIELSDILHLQVSTGGFDSRSHQVWRQIAAVFSKLQTEDPALAAEYGFPGVLLPMTVADESLVQSSERLIADGLDGRPGMRAFVARPRVFVTSVGPAAGDGRLSTGTDLMTDTVQVLVADGTEPRVAADSQLWYGALEGALESEFLLSRLGSGGLTDGQLHGVSFGVSGPATLVTDAGPRVPAGASTVLAQDIDAGLVAVVPGDLATADSWWRVDPRTGVSQAISDPGGGNSAYTNAVTNTAGRIFADPSKIPQTEAQLQQLYREAIASVEGGRPPVQPTCIGGNEYGSLVCNVLRVAPALFLLGVVVGIIVWIA